MSHALAVSERSNQPIGVLFIDLDGFKIINDTLGHHVGNTALSKVAERLTAIVRPGDTLAHIGGDEFVMLCAGTDGACGAAAVARRILDAFAQPFVLEGREINIGASSALPRRWDPRIPIASSTTPIPRCTKPNTKAVAGSRSTTRSTNLSPSNASIPKKPCVERSTTTSSGSTTSPNSTWNRATSSASKHSFDGNGPTAV
jgi:hypothetical protein